MLTAYKSKLRSNVDRMAWDHLVRAGVIADREKKPKASTRGRVGWKKLNPTGWHKGGCDQCGAWSGTRNGWPYDMALCPDCSRVHTHALAHGLKPSQEIFW